MSQQTITKQFPTSSELVELFVQDCRDREMTSDSIRHYKSVVSHFFTFLANHVLSPYQADKQIFIEYLRYRKSEGVCEKTLQNNFAALSTFYEFMLFQDYVVKNPMTGIRKRYRRRYKNDKDVDAESPRKLISVEQMSLLINSVLDTRDRAILTVLAKTGVRRGELIAMDVGDIDWTEQLITLKKFKKRSGRTVFFDDETARVLKRWINQRENMEPNTYALFVGEKGGRLKRHGVYSMVVKYAEQVGLHDSKSEKPEDHFTPHCFRHWYTTWLRRGGMDREFIKILRGDRRTDAVSIYDRVDPAELKRAYLAFIPRLAL